MNPMKSSYLTIANDFDRDHSADIAVSRLNRD